MISVSQYNILSMALANKFYYVHTPTTYLQPNYRWQLLKDKLMKQINNQSIICLQEVCYDWLEKLVPFFNHYDYNYQYTQFQCHQGFVGLITAYPSKYKLEAVKMIHIGDYIKKRLTRFSVDTPIDKNDPWFKAIIKHNMLLCLKLSINHQHFCVINYHMPQSHQNQTIGLLHLIACIQNINKFVNNLKFIFAGDFNFQPFSLLYQVITKGGNYKNNVDKSTNYDTSQFNLKVSTCMSNCYPDNLLYTNYVHTLDHLPWHGCIDYILTSPGWKVIHVDNVVNDFVEGPFPNQNESSDHLMIGATLNL